MFELPCKTCQSECCGALPVREGELRRILALIKTWPKRKVKRLARQKRPFATCPFVDQETWTCTIYDARPTLCQLFGWTPGMVCPYAPHLATEIRPEVARNQLSVDAAFYGPVVAILGINMGWKDLIRLRKEEIRT